MIGAMRNTQLLDCRHDVVVDNRRFWLEKKILIPVNRILNPFLTFLPRPPKQKTTIYLQYGGFLSLSSLISFIASATIILLWYRKERLTHW